MGNAGKGGRRGTNGVLFLPGGKAQPTGTVSTQAAPDDPALDDDSPSVDQVTSHLLNTIGFKTPPQALARMGAATRHHPRFGDPTQCVVVDQFGMWDPTTGAAAISPGMSDLDVGLAGMVTAENMPAFRADVKQGKPAQLPTAAPVDAIPMMGYGAEPWTGYETYRWAALTPGSLHRDDDLAQALDQVAPVASVESNELSFVQIEAHDGRATLTATDRYMIAQVEAGTTLPDGEWQVYGKAAPKKARVGVCPATGDLAFTDGRGSLSISQPPASGYPKLKNLLRPDARFETHTSRTGLTAIPVGPEDKLAHRPGGASAIRVGNRVIQMRTTHARQLAALLHGKEADWHIPDTDPARPDRPQMVHVEAEGVRVAVMAWPSETPAQPPPAPTPSPSGDFEF
jgi:hypothetical protein